MHRLTIITFGNNIHLVAIAMFRLVGRDASLQQRAQRVLWYLFFGLFIGSQRELSIK
jgi:hypothetical protein